MSEYHELHCTECKAAIFLEEENYKRRLSDGKIFFCPNGHEQVFREPTERKLQKQIDYLHQHVEALEEENKYLHHAINGYKGQLGKLKKKIKALEEFACAARVL